jgi:hypothetical protein
MAPLWRRSDDLVASYTPRMGSIRLDSYTVLTLRTGDNPPDLTDEERMRLQDAHLSPG